MSAKATLDGERGSLLGWKPRVLLAYIEGLARQDKEQAKSIDRLYRELGPKPIRAHADRVSEIQDFLKRVG